MIESHKTVGVVRQQHYEPNYSYCLISPPPGWLQNDGLPRYIGQGQGHARQGKLRETAREKGGKNDRRGRRLGVAYGCGDARERRNRVRVMRGSAGNVHVLVHAQVYRQGQALTNGSEYRSGEVLTVRVEGRADRKSVV